MEEKSYRVYRELTAEAKKRKIEYMIRTETDISERDMINALISTGLEKATDKDIDNFMNKLDK